jgi:hypothetical protein
MQEQMRRLFEIRAALGFPSANAEPFKPAELRALDKLLGFLSDPAPYFQPGNASDNAQLVAVCGNWYDLPHKAQILARTPKTTELLLAGGRAERLTSADAERVGGEPLLLQRRLVEKYGVDVRRTIVWSGSRVTNHNLLAALAYAKQVRDFSQRRTDTTFVEERFLVRREAASLAHLLGADAAARDAVATVRFHGVGARSFSALTRLHRGRHDIALALLLGEFDRLERYATAHGNSSTTTHGSRKRTHALLGGGALDGLGVPLRRNLAAIRATHAALLAKGRELLERAPRQQMQREAAPG